MFGNILAEEVRFPSKISSEARDLLGGLLVKDPTHRLGGGRHDARDIMNHVFFASIDWALLVQKKVKEKKNNKSTLLEKRSKKAFTIHG